MADDRKPTGEGGGLFPKPAESLSQFLAKVLDQLSLSAWLPSAALVLIVTFVVNLRSAKGSLGDALGAFSKYKFADAAFLFAAVVVLTVLTQAFEFEAIRFLEGYWGPRHAGEWAADIGCAFQRRRRDHLERRRSKWDEKAFEKAYYRLSGLVQAGRSGSVNERDLQILLANRNGTKVDGMTRAELVHALKVGWRDEAPARFVRREEHLRTAVRSYPAGNRVLPTRLGNLLRSYEDQAFPDLKGQTLFGAVQRVFHLLPLEVQLEHDQNRTRLDLYCSMVIVTAVVTGVAVVLLRDLHGLAYSLGVVGIGAAAAWLFYRAGITSAEAYGELLLVIGTYVPMEHQRAQDVPSS